MPNIEKATLVLLRIIIPAGFIIFLLTSIDHLAWSFGIFDDNPYRQYGDAIAVDLTCAIVSIYTMFCYNRLSGSGKVSVWIVIIGLLGFSWWGNWHYAVAHRNAQIYANAELAPFAEWDTAIFSAAIVFGAVYIKLASSLSIKDPTAEELIKLANEITAKTNAEKTLREAKSGQRAARKGIFAEKVAAAMGEAGSTLKQGRAAWKAAKNGDQQEVNKEEQDKGAKQEPSEITPGTSQQETTPNQEEKETSDQGDSAKMPTARPRLTVVDGGRQPKKAHRVRGERETASSLPISKAAVELEIDEAEVKKLLRKGILKHPPRNERMVLRDSIVAYKQRAS